MAIEQEDYVVRMIAAVGQMLARITGLRQERNYGEALQINMVAQEKLFGQPAQEFVSLPVADQLAMLAKGEPAPLARAKGLAYAALLKEAALVYRARDNEDLAASAFELALFVTLTLAAESPAATAELRPQIAELLPQVRVAELHQPVRVLLDQIEAAG